jgi:FkbM family methyltransferase
VTASQIPESRRSSLFGLITDPYACLSFSQFGEDTLILEYLSGKNLLNKCPFYVDIGAYHPSRFSNTKLLNFLGWRGINVDPNPDAIELFNKARPGDLNLNVGVSTMSGTADLFCFTEGAINTFDEKEAQKHIKEGWVFTGRHSVQIFRINDLLNNFLPETVKQSGIGLLDIDCEGLDAEIINDLDLDKFKPLILAVESHEFDFLKPQENRICKKLFNEGYILVAYLGPTLLFLRENLK